MTAPSGSGSNPPSGSASNEKPRWSDHPVVQLSLARTREFLREPEAIFWVFVFPIVFSLALALAFRSKPPEPIPVGVLIGEGGAGGGETILRRLASSADLKPRLVSEAEASAALRSGKLPAVVVGVEPLELWLDPARPEAREARLAVELALAPSTPGAPDGGRPAPSIRESKERGARYIDFFVPGLLGMNLMGTGMWAIGFALVQQRQGGLLKRFIASPMKRWQFLVSQIISRLVFLAAESSALLGFAYFLLGVPIRGAFVLLVLVAILGAMTFVGIGLLVASRARTIEGVSGIMNLVMVPMWVGSGTFFSTERFPDAMQPFVQALPLTALNDALRGVMLDGAGLAQLAPELGLLALWGGVSFFAALKMFRWQ